MKWSQLKKRIEGNFADSATGRVQVWTTRYRKSHDAEGEAWVTIDKQRVSSMGSYSYLVAAYHEQNRLRTESGCADYRDPEQREGYNNAYHEAERLVKDRGIFPLWDFNRALFDFLSLSIDDAIASDNPIIRALATLDRRFGKRRLREFDDSDQPPLVKTLYRFRCKVEGITRVPEQHAGQVSSEEAPSAVAPVAAAGKRWADDGSALGSEPTP